jgi:two-component system response regulator FimZ (fimbrial Z protein)
MNIAIYNPLKIICKGIEIVLKENFSNSNLFIADSILDIIEFSNALFFDIIIIEINESQNESLSMIRKIKNIQPKTNILLFSSIDDHIYISNCLKSGASGFLKLSSNKDIIINTIASLMNGNGKINNYLQEKENKKKSTEYYAMTRVLSEREYQIAKMLIKGLSNKEISYKLSLVATTVSTYKLRILTKTNCKNTLSLSRKMKKLEDY